MYTYKCEKCGKEVVVDRRFVEDAKHANKEDGEYCGGKWGRQYQATTVIIKGKR